MTPVREGSLPTFDLSPKKQPEYLGFSYTGFVKIPKDGVYEFFTDSDDGSQLVIDDSLVVNNDYLHPMDERSGVTALAAGFHSLRVTFFQKTGGIGLNVSFKGPGIEKQNIPPDALFHTK